MFILTYKKLYKKIKSLKNSAYSDGILTIVEDEYERGFGIRRYNDFYIYGEVGWNGANLDGFGFDMGLSLKISKDIDDVIRGYVEYITEDISDDNTIWKGIKPNYRASNETLFKYFKEDKLNFKLNLDDYDASLWEK